MTAKKHRPMDTDVLRAACACARCGVDLDGVPDVLTVHSHCAPGRAVMGTAIGGPRLLGVKPTRGAVCDVCLDDAEHGNWAHLMLCKDCMRECKRVPRTRALQCCGCLVRSYKPGGILYPIHNTPTCAPSLASAPNPARLFERGSTGEPCCACGKAGLPKTGLVYLCSVCAPTAGQGRTRLRPKATTNRRPTSPPYNQYKIDGAPLPPAQIEVCLSCGLPLRATGMCGCS